MPLADDGIWHVAGGIFHIVAGKIDQALIDSQEVFGLKPITMLQCKGSDKPRKIAFCWDSVDGEFLVPEMPPGFQWHVAWAGPSLAAFEVAFLYEYDEQPHN
ncbi:MAG TPA: hypothetical protein VKR56_07155 [Candidatus Cybelea sp.]|nr:hypothetical protein [Candidatus Cybelea sp.]